MRFGVNYTPREGWFHHWVDFDESEVARDLDTIAGLGVDHVRVFPLWPVFQPNPTMVSPAMLARLESVIALAGARGLAVAVDGLQGHLSSFDFLPSWLVTWHRRNMFTDPDAIAATVRYLSEVSAAAARHDNVVAITVGNEVNQFTGDVHPDPHPASTEDVTRWLDATIGAIRRGAPGVPALHACYDASWFSDAQPFTLEHVARAGDMTVVHSWAFNGTGQRYGADAFETRALARYLVEVARAFQSDPDRPVWMQEVGAPRNVVPEESVPGFVRGTVANLAGAEHLYGITWWCSHDVGRALGDFPEVEYDLGLIDSDGVVKPEGRLLREAIEEARSTVPGTGGASTRPELVLDPARGRSVLAPGGSFFTEYMTAAREQGHPRVRLTTHEAAPAGAATGGARHA
ncbi:cellulase family glycosylhydrolase [Isoptericola sp. BMS4]|uniref:glycoside hydrolase 5 family protein n=1 Tax=Isoptericola sp. BMS4 TaxID=2527875 RepID=UPI0014201DD2|nr:cellulase family glycosylhydrolase [Isoptericola sp. BMS4]